MRKAAGNSVVFSFRSLQLREPAEGPSGEPAAPSPAPTSPRSMTTALTAPGPSWLSLGIPSLLFLLTSSWRRDMTS